MGKLDTYSHESFWPQIREATERQGAQGAVDLARSIEDPYERVSFFRFCIRGLMFRNWTSKTLDPIVQLAEVAIADTIASADRGGSDEAWFTDQANILCYNMASNLADCWGDGIERDARHFRQGLSFAERAIRLREALKKGPGPLYMAYWSKGIHQLLLGQVREGLESLEKSSKYAADSALAQEKPAIAGRDAPFEVILSTGYLGIARLLNGVPEGKSLLMHALGAFEEMKVISPETKEDAELGLAQLTVVGKRFGLI